MVSLDPYTGVGLDGGHLVAVLKSGRRVPVEATVPVDGVLRLRIGSPPPVDGVLVPDLPERPAELVTGPDGGVAIRGPGVDAVWGAEGQHFRFGRFARFSEPRASTVPFLAGARPATDDRTVGWVETLHLAPEARVYGGGESYQGPDLRGRHRLLRNTEEDRRAGRDSAYLNVPLLWSDAGWGVLVHTGGTVGADLGFAHAEAARIEVDGPGIDLFLLAGTGPEILRAYHALTGPPAPLPEWAFGVWMSRSSYFTADEVVDVVDELAAADCPVDVVHVDEWLDEPVLGDAAWSADPDRGRFPAGWTRRLADRGVRASVWINPYLAKGSPLAAEAADRGFLLRDPDGSPAGTADNPDTHPVDFTNPAARDWWAGRLATLLRDEGVAALLADFGEEIPTDAVFADGGHGVDRHNLYGLEYARTVWEVAERVRPGDCAPLFRAGTVGSQRTPGHWAGDLPSSWVGLVSSLRACLSMSLSGFAFVSHDAGGYWTPASYQRAQELRETMTPDAVAADVDPELYARWAQFAAFSPLMRFHGVGRREPTGLPGAGPGRRAGRLPAAPAAPAVPGGDRRRGDREWGADDASDGAGLPGGPDRPRGRTAVPARPGRPGRAAAGAGWAADGVGATGGVGAAAGRRPALRPGLAGRAVRRGRLPGVRPGRSGPRDGVRGPRRGVRGACRGWVGVRDPGGRGTGCRRGAGGRGAGGRGRGRPGRPRRRVGRDRTYGAR